MFICLFVLVSILMNLSLYTIKLMFEVTATIFSRFYVEYVHCSPFVHSLMQGDSKVVVNKQIK